MRINLGPCELLDSAEQLADIGVFGQETDGLSRQDAIEIRCKGLGSRLHRLIDHAGLELDDGIDTFRFKKLFAEYFFKIPYLNNLLLESVLQIAHRIRNVVGSFHQQNEREPATGPPAECGARLLVNGPFHIYYSHLFLNLWLHPTCPSV